jgi:hypothetical protein
MGQRKAIQVTLSGLQEEEQGWGIATSRGDEVACRRQWCCAHFLLPNGMQSLSLQLDAAASVGTQRRLKTQFQ